MFGGEASGGFFDLTMAKPGKIDQPDIVVMGIPCATPYTSVGPYWADAPDAIRAAFGWPGVLNHHDFDIDVIDPAVVPSVIGPAPGGFSYWQLLEIIEAAARRAPVVGFNLVELMPSADIGGRGALVGARIMAMMLGLVARQRSA